MTTDAGTGATATERSDALDKRIAALPVATATGWRLTAVGLGGILVLVLLALLGEFLVLVNQASHIKDLTRADKALSESNNRLLQEQIPPLRLRIRERDAEIKKLNKQTDQLNYVLQQQAIPAIIAMQDQIRKLGGTPPNVLLEPSKPPFGQ